MKKIKMTIAAAMFCAAAFAGYTAYEQATMTDQEKIFLANIEALTIHEPGDSAGDDCPNGGYYSTGARSEDLNEVWAKIDITTGAVISFSETPISATAEFSVEMVQTVAYSCDQNNNGICLVCNRYVL